MWYFPCRLFHPSSRPTGHGLLYPFYRWEWWGTEWLGTISRISQLSETTFEPLSSLLCQVLSWLLIQDRWEPGHLTQKGSQANSVWVLPANERARGRPPKTIPRVPTQWLSSNYRHSVRRACENWLLHRLIKDVRIMGWDGQLIFHVIITATTYSLFRKYSGLLVCSLYSLN